MMKLPEMLSGPATGWLLAAAALAAGYVMLGWQGVLLAGTMIVFWLLLQFSRALRAVRNAADAPVGSVRSAVMLQSRLRTGMTMPQVLALTRSLGEEAAGNDVWRWCDGGGVTVTVRFVRGRVSDWTLDRPQDVP